MSPAPAQQARAQAIAAEITTRLVGVAYALPDTIADRLTRCGHPRLPLPRRPPRSRTARTTSGPARKTAGPPSAS